MKIAFDIDDTLYKCRRTHPGGQFPDYDLIQVLRWFYSNGDYIFVWSAGGVEYAKQIVEKLGLERMVSVIPKVKLGDDSNPHEIDIAFDDCETKLAKIDVVVRRPDGKECLTCGVPLIPHVYSYEGQEKRWDGHTYAPNCKCHPKGTLLSIG